MKTRPLTSFRSLLVFVIVFTVSALVPIITLADETMIAYEPSVNFTQKDVSWIALSTKINQNMTEKKYAEALGIFVWYYDNALKYNRSEYGVRNSFTLSQWIQLGKDYPPALAELQKIRDAKTKLFLDNKIALTYPGANANGTPRDWQQNPAKNQDEWELYFSQQKGDTPNFHDIASINRELKTPDQTVTLFLEVEKSNPALAQKVWHYAEDTILEQKNYAIATRYIPDVKAEWKRRFDSFTNDNMQNQLTKEQYQGYQKAIKEILTKKADQLSALAKYQKQDQVAEEIQNELKAFVSK